MIIGHPLPPKRPGIDYQVEQAQNWTSNHRMILGLRRGKVRLVAHQAGWSAVFQGEKKRLARLLGASALAIEHVGSTAVPDLMAKPIIDIAVAVAGLADLPGIAARVRVL